jgi:hypothetical protein
VTRPGATSVQEFKQALVDLIDAPATDVILGTYRGTIPAIQYFDPATKLYIAVNADTGEFITAFKLSERQEYYLFTRGNVQ